MFPSSALLLLTVYYECLCPDSRSFFTDQLHPVMEKLSDYIQVDLIPYGHASFLSQETNWDSWYPETFLEKKGAANEIWAVKAEGLVHRNMTTVKPDGQFTFKCQHGATECLGNKVHACSILRAKDDLTRVRLATCMINNNYIPDKIGQECCEKYGINWDDVQSCAHGDQGSILLNKFGQLTHSLNPPITFVPTISINKDFRNQALILKNLLKVVCEHLNKLNIKPQVCRDQM